MNPGTMGALIARLRKEKNMTQQELASRLQIADKAVSKWERGLSCPDISLLPQLAEILGVTVDDLVSDGMKTPSSVFGKLGREDIREMASLMFRCVSMALCAGGLLVYCLGGISVSDLCVMLCLAVILLGLDSFCK